MKTVSKRMQELEKYLFGVEKGIDRIRFSLPYKGVRKVRSLKTAIMMTLFPEGGVIRKIKNSETYNRICHLYARITRRYFVEDFVRVYPDGIAYDIDGNLVKGGSDVEKNFMNHKKFYVFASQFVKGGIVADLGCGSGYGCKILNESGAKKVCGTDISKKAIDFAKKRYSQFAEFSAQNIARLKGIPDHVFDVVVCSEVLEHIKEFGVEDTAINEIKRVCKKHGIIVIATPNSELLPGHGFSYQEITSLFQRNFVKFCIFENSFVPFDEKTKRLWEDRRISGNTGIVIAEDINLNEVICPPGVQPKLKSGKAAGTYNLDGIEINTKLLHNTHSWIVVAKNSSKTGGETIYEESFDNKR